MKWDEWIRPNNIISEGSEMPHAVRELLRKWSDEINKLSLKPLGSFVYLDMLKEPFFKIESDYYMIKNMDIDFYDTLDLRQRFFVLEFHEEAGD